jgi:hypothetical protein
MDIFKVKPKCNAWCVVWYLYKDCDSYTNGTATLSNGRTVKRKWWWNGVFTFVWALLYLASYTYNWGVNRNAYEGLYAKHYCSLILTKANGGNKW